MKPTRQFTLYLIAFLFSLIWSITCYANEAIDIPVTKNDTPDQTGRQRAPFRTPLTASYTSDALNFSFLYPVGNATITITDDFGAVVYTESIDTTIEPDLFILIDEWDAGFYHITIQYGCNTLTAELEL